MSQEIGIIHGIANLRDHVIRRKGTNIVITIPDHFLYYLCKIESVRYPIGIPPKEDEEKDPTIEFTLGMDKLSNITAIAILHEKEDIPNDEIGESIVRKRIFRAHEKIIKFLEKEDSLSVIF